MARRISRRTTDLLAIAIVLIGGLSMADRVIDWWRTEPGEVLSAAARKRKAGEFPWKNEAVSLRLGIRGYGLDRKTITGDGEEARRSLLAWTGQRLGSAPWPSQPPEKAERELLQSLRALRPRVEFPRIGGRVDVIPGPVTMVVGSRENAQSARRVVTWGVAFRQGDNRWALFRFRPSCEQNSTRIALPATARRRLSLEVPGGEAIIAMDGSGPPRDWIQFFQRQSERNEWTRQRPWNRSSGGWSARYHRGPSGDGETIAIHFTQTGAGRLSGLLRITWSATSSARGER